jgi:hypothetical protein
MTPAREAARTAAAISARLGAVEPAEQATGASPRGLAALRLAASPASEVRDHVLMGRHQREDG